MRAIQISGHVAGPSQLKVVTLPTPNPSSSAYLIEIHASATNFFDLLQIRGKYQHQPPLPFISGSEFAGKVIAVPTAPSPTGAHKFNVGDHVFGSSQGGYATHTLAPETSLRPMPDGWDYMSAAGLMVTAPTGYAAIVTRAQVQAHETVLVHAAAGGVGLAAVQVAKAVGATVIATASTERKLEVAKAFGADHCVDYTKPKWEETVKALTPKRKGVDVVFDPVGVVDKSLKCIAWGGRVVIIGFTSGNIEKIAMNRVLLKNISLVGLHWGTYTTEAPEAVEGVWKALFQLMSQNKFRGTTFTDREFVGLESVPEALAMLETRMTWGKVVVQVPQPSESKL